MVVVEVDLAVVAPALDALVLAVEAEAAAVARVCHPHFEAMGVSENTPSLHRKAHKRIQRRPRICATVNRTAPYLFNLRQVPTQLKVYFGEILTLN